MLSESGNYESVTKSQTASALYATGEQHGEQANNCSPTQKHQAVEGPHRGHTKRRGIPYLSTSSIAIRLELLPLLEKSCIRTRHYRIRDIGRERARDQTEGSSHMPDGRRREYRDAQL